MSLKVLHVTKELNSGGIESVICSWYSNINKEKVDFDFAIHWEKNKGIHEDEVTKAGAVIYRFKNLRECGSIHKYKKQWETFWSEHIGEYSIVHIHYMSHAGLIADVARKYGLRVFIHSHSTNPDEKNISINRVITKFLNRNILKKADVMLACSLKAGIDFFGEEFKVNGIVIKNAIDLERYAYNDTVRNDIRNKYNLDNKIIIGHIGNYVAHKNQDFMLEIFSNIVHINPNVHLVWGG